MLERLKAQDGQTVLLSEYKLWLACWDKSGPDGVLPELRESQPAPEGSSGECGPSPAAGPTVTGLGQGQALITMLLRY